MGNSGIFSFIKKVSKVQQNHNNNTTKEELSKGLF